ncbi:SulP family inorganic anion transporter [soil metagenome]
MVPETIGFALLMGVNPLVGLYASFITGLATALFGGRPGMITGGAGSIAVVAVAVVRLQGVEGLFLAVSLMGLLMVAFGLLRWGKFIAMVPHPVMLGFVNGLAIVIFRAQLDQLKPNGHWLTGVPLLTMLGLIAATVALVVLTPRVTKALPPALVAIAVVAGASRLFHVPTRLVGDLGQVRGGLPGFHLPDLGAWSVVLPYAAVMAGVALTESLLTLGLVDELTETDGDPNRECVALGIGNVLSGLFGGMGGCAMIGQTVINVSSGGKRRLSGVVEALCILSFVLVASGLIEAIPLAALVGVMMVVVTKTFAWSSLRLIGKVPKADLFVLALVSVVTVFTNLATAVVVGVIVSALEFAWRNGTRLDVARTVDAEGRTVYRPRGHVFFASVQGFSRAFEPREDSQETLLDLSEAHLHDHSALQAVHALTARYEGLGKRLVLTNVLPDAQILLSRGSGTFAIVAEEPARPN